MTGRRLALVVWFSAALLIAGIAAIPILASEEPADGEHGDEAVIDLAALAPAIAANYRYSAAHQDHFAAIDCYCGCVDFLGHRDLADCFVTETGTPEPHAAGCGVCNGEATLARSLLEDDVALAEVVRQVDAVYGTTVGTAPMPPTSDRSAT
jgi:hypothetical protein